MASSVATTFHSAADGETFSAAAWRLGAVSHAGVANDGTDALKSRPGILSAFGTPLDVTQLGSPAMQVTVKKGTVFQQSSAANGGVYSHSLTSDTNLDIATAHATNPRLDAVVATVFDDGTSASNTKIEVLTGTAAASPALPSALSSPPSNTHYFPLAQVRVEAAVTSIVTAKITKPVFGTVTMGQFTCAPGGTVRDTKRTWQSAVAPGTPIPLSSGIDGGIVSISVPAAELLPGVYSGKVAGHVRNMHSTLSCTMYFKVVTPDGTEVHVQTVPALAYWTFTESFRWVTRVVPGSAQYFALNFQHDSAANAEIGYSFAPCIIELTRESDF